MFGVRVPHKSARVAARVGDADVVAQMTRILGFFVGIRLISESPHLQFIEDRTAPRLPPWAFGLTGCA
jgi:hypothetical protein